MYALWQSDITSTPTVKSNTCALVTITALEHVRYRKKSIKYVATKAGCHIGKKESDLWSGCVFFSWSRRMELIRQKTIKTVMDDAWCVHLCIYYVFLIVYAVFFRVKNAFRHVFVSVKFWKVFIFVYGLSLYLKFYWWFHITCFF